MIYKHSHFSGVSSTGDPLLQIIYPDREMTKVAGVHPEILAYKNQLEPEPNTTYVHILALGAGEWYGPNLNNDHFPWSGLEHDNTKTPHQYLHGYKTFLNAHAFAHHQNKDPEKAYGDVLLSVLNDKMKRVELIAAIDHEKCIRNGGKRVLERVQAGEFPATSMGTRVPFDVCSICGHKAKFRSEYCEHMLTMAGKILPDGRKVFVFNPYPRFFDISFVFIGADRTSFVLEKIAAQVPANYNLEKSAGFFSGLMSGLDPRPGTSEGLGRLDSLRGSNLATGPGAFIGGAVTGALTIPSIISGVTGAVSGGIKTPGNRLMGAAKGLVTGIQQPIRSAIDIVKTRDALTRVLKSPGPVTLLPKEMESLSRVIDKIPGEHLRGISGGINAIEGALGNSPVTQKEVAYSILTATDKMGKGRLIEAGLGGTLSGYAAMNDYNEGLREKQAEIKIALDKVSDIFKEVSSTPMGRAIPILANSERDLPDETLDSLAEMPNFPKTLASLGSLGMALKPREFQRVSLVHMGQRTLADQLDAMGGIFPVSDGIDRNMKITIQISTGDPSSIFDLLSPFFASRSCLTPIAIRRLSSPMLSAPPLQEMGNLLKLSHAYNGYRRGLLLNTENLVKTAMGSTDIIKTAESMGSAFADAAKGTLSEKATLIAAMAAIPLLYFTSAHWDAKYKNGEDVGFIKEFIAKNPSLSAALMSGGTAIGLHELFKKFPLEKIVEMAKTLK